ncbi:hypothetical protein B0H13DRAFT_1868896 [Mycena leptocephala]|nr:hypothetical protein B0H13DRAFT_1868896 [Mycena leptocephala]
MVLPMLQKADASNETKIEHLDYFLGVAMGEKNLERSEKLKKDEKEAERISRDFTQLKLIMANEVIELQNAVNICEAKLKGYTTTTLSEFASGQRNGLAIGAGAGVIVGVLAFCGGMAATGILALVALVGAAITGLIAVGLGTAADVEHFKVIADAESDLKTAQLKRDDALKRQEDLIEKIAPEIDAAIGACTNICDKLDNFATIFKHIWTDCQSAGERLTTPIDDDAPALFHQLFSYKAALLSSKRQYCHRTSIGAEPWTKPERCRPAQWELREARKWGLRAGRTQKKSLYMQQIQVQMTVSTDERGAGVRAK